MKKLMMMVLMGLVLVVGTACSPEKEAVDTPEQVEEEQAPVDDAGGVDEDHEVVEEPSQVEDDLHVVDSLKEHDLVGKDLNEVKQLLGEPLVDHKDSVMHAYRYDYAKGNYFYNNDLISVDVKGLEGGQMEAQHFIYFEQEKVVSHSIYFLKDEEIMQYFVNQAGAEEYPAQAD